MGVVNLSFINHYFRVNSRARADGDMMYRIYIYIYIYFTVEAPERPCRISAHGNCMMGTVIIIYNTRIHVGNK